MQATTTCQVINFVFYGESCEAARSLVNSVIGGNEDKSFWVHSGNGVELRGYIRWPNSTPTATPIGTTDCLVVQTSSGSEHLTEIQNYVGSRRGIPFRVVVSDDDMSDWAKTVEMEYVASSQISSLQEKLVNSAKTLEETLRKVFNKIDSNGNGLVEKSEIANLANELGHTLNSSEIDEISQTLAGEDGNISYRKFKTWWITGRSNFVEFRKLVEIEMSVGKLLKLGSSHFNSYLEGLQKEMQNASNEVEYRARISIGPQNEFPNGVGISMHVAAGNDYNSIQSSLPDYASHSPVFYSMEIGIKDAEHGPMIVAKLNELKEMAAQMIPQVGQALSLGFEVHFRNVANSVFVDLTLGGQMAEQMMMAFSVLNKIQVFINGNSNFHVTSGFNPVHLVNKNIEENLSAASNLKIEGSGEFSQVKAFIQAFTNILTSYQDFNHLSSQMKSLLFGLKFLSCLKKYDFDLKYSSNELTSFIKEIINMVTHNHYDNLAEKFSHYQMTMKAMIEQGKGMLMFVADYLEIIKNINFDSISMNCALPKSQLFYKLTLHVPEVTAFLHENLLN